VITDNVKDFRPLAAERLARGQSHGGLILLPRRGRARRASREHLADAIERVLRNHPDGLVSSEQWVGPLTVRDEEVNQRRFRFAGLRTPRTSAPSAPGLKERPDPSEGGAWRRSSEMWLETLL